MDPLKILLGFAVAFFLGAFCRFINIPLPAPPSVIGVLLILAVTLGAFAADWYLAKP